MLEVLKLFNYNPPNFDIIEDNNIKTLGPTGPIKAFEVKKFENGTHALYIHGQQWMMYQKDHMQAAQLFSHYYIASGNVIATGLGFAAREFWILNNSNVKSLTVLEKSQDVIDYHKKVNPSLFKKANIICCDARTYKGKCDTLLLDHYEFETTEETIKDVKKICENIECKKMWFWHLETQIIADLHGIHEQGIWDRFRKGTFKINVATLKNILPIYESIKNRYKLDKLPNLTAEELQLIVTMNTLFFQKM